MEVIILEPNCHIRPAAFHIHRGPGPREIFGRLKPHRHTVYNSLMRCSAEGSVEFLPDCSFMRVQHFINYLVRVEHGGTILRGILFKKQTLCTTLTLYNTLHQTIFWFTHLQLPQNTIYLKKDILIYYYDSPVY